MILGVSWCAGREGWLPGYFTRMGHATRAPGFWYGAVLRVLHCFALIACVAACLLARSLASY